MIVTRVKEGVDKAKRVGTHSGRPFGHPKRGNEVKGPKKKAITELEICGIFARIRVLR